MYILSLLQVSPLFALVFLLSLVAAVTVHEFAHAWAAYKLGDDTAYLQGRVTLNPSAHLDPLGSILFLLIGLGWGKPVIYNPMRLAKKSYELAIALAGPASNLLFALFLNMLSAVLGSFMPAYQEILSQAALLNVALAAFNMLPIPPLDGSAVIAYFWPEYRSLTNNTAVYFLLFFLLISTGIISLFVHPIAIFFNQATHLFGLL